MKKSYRSGKLSYNIWKEVYNSYGEFIGYTERVGFKEYNHYTRDGKYIISTDQEEFDFEKYEREHDDEEEWKIFLRNQKESKISIWFLFVN